MDTFEDYIISFLLLGLFVVCTISFGNQMAFNYGKAGRMDTGYIDTARIESQVNQTATQANQWGESFKSDNPIISYGSLITVTLFGIIKLMWTSIMGFLSIFLDLAVGIFQIPAIVVGTITAIIIISIIFLIWRKTRQGQ